MRLSHHQVFCNQRSWYTELKPEDLHIALIISPVDVAMECQLKHVVFFEQKKRNVHHNSVWRRSSFNLVVLLHMHTWMEKVPLLSRDVLADAGFLCHEAPCSILIQETPCIIICSFAIWLDSFFATFWGHILQGCQLGTNCNFRQQRLHEAQTDCKILIWEP